MIPEFVLQLICGLAVMWTTIPCREITSGFFRIQNLLALGLAVLAAVTADQFAPTRTGSFPLHVIEFGIAIVLAVLTFLGSIFWSLERRQGGIRIAVLIAVIGFAGMLLAVAASPVSQVPKFLQIVDSCSTAWLLGAVTATMLLGHWYLTATGMALRPFVLYTKVLLAAALARILVVAGAAVMLPGVSDSSWTLQVLRWAGLIGPAILAVLTLRILRYRNTQSATGVLYAATILVFMGEMAGSLMSAGQTNGAGM